MVRKFACLLMTGALALGALGCSGEEEKKGGTTPAAPATGDKADDKAPETN